MSKVDIPFLQRKAYDLRVDSIKSTTAAGSGHPTSALSAADLVAALFFYAMKFDIENPDNPDNDRFILSKGHAAPVLYSAWKELGVLTEEQLLTLRQFNSMLEGHPTPRFKYVDAATGSLGCGLSIGLGMALSTRLSNHQFYTYVLLGDSEMAEGSVWEAIELASYYKVDKLIALVDLNRLGQSTETIDDHNAKRHEERWKAFGWDTIVINGHDMCAIVDALNKAKTIVGKPTVIIALTVKGYGVKSVADKNGFHGKPFSKEELPHVLEELKRMFSQISNYPEKKKLSLHLKSKRTNLQRDPIQLPACSYKRDTLIATRKAYGEALSLLGDYATEVLSLDAEVKNSTFAEIFEKKYPHRFFQCFIAEQNMIGMAIGLTSRGYIPFSSTFAAFLTRAHDQIRMAAIGRVPLRIMGSHCGVSIGQDGPSQMGLEDIAQMRALPQSIILYPSDAVSTFALVNLMVNYHDGISYLRCTRSATPTIYNCDEKFIIGGCNVLRESDNDVACIIAAGITLFQALEAYENLKNEGIYVSVIDLYSVKPLNTEKIKSQVLKAKKRLITVEDHYIQGGIGEALCYELRNEGITIEVLAVTELPHSGSEKELLAFSKIDAESIQRTVKKIIKGESLS